jgi:hypothetical protein
VDDHFVAVSIDACAITTKDHWELLRTQADSLKAPKVVMVQRGGTQRH